MNSRLMKFAAVGVIALLIGILAMFILGRQGGEKIAQKVVLPATFSTSAAFGDRSVVLSNGRALLRYDYTNGTTTLISPDDATGGVGNIDSLSVSSDNKYLLFHSEHAPAKSAMETTLIQHRLDSTLDYWWVFNLSDQTFKPLPAGVLIAKFHNDRIDALAPGDTAESITSYRLEDLSQTGRINIPGSSNFWAYKSGFLLQLADESVAYTTDGVVNQTYYSNVSLLGLVSSSDTAFGVASGSNNTRQLLELNLQDQSQKVIVDKLAGQPVMSASGTVLYTTAGKITPAATTTLYASYDAKTHKTTAWDLSGSASGLTTNNNAKLTSLMDNTTALISDSKTSNYLIGKSLYQVKPFSGYTKTISLQGVNSTINYDDATGAFIVRYVPSQATTIQPAVYQQLKQDGYNPDMFAIDFTTAQD